MTHPKAILITGSTSGIGLGIAQKFASQGFKVAINGLGSESENTDVIQSLRSAGAKEVLFHGANMLQPDQIADLIKTTHDAFGRIDVLVNNAGIQHVSPVEDFPDEKWNAIIGINLSSGFHTIKHTAPIMKAQKSGRIINIASAHALVASPYKSAYVAAKHGIAGLTKTIALELATFNITVNAVCPAYVWTPLVEKQIPDTAKARNMTEQQVIDDVLLKAQPTKRFVEIEEVAEFVNFLASDAAKSITGGIHTIDAGWTAQ